MATTDAKHDSALKGIRVLDLTRVVAGPLATQTLGDLGAEVIKIERVDGGDDVRHAGPPWIDFASGERSSTYFQAVNRNKKSVSVSFSSASGQELLRNLAKKCDVFVENYRPGTLAKYGLDYDSLKDLHPGLIYCSVTGFGHHGCYSSRSGYDYLLQGMTGLMNVTGHPQDDPGGGPLRVGIPLVDIFAGMNATIGVLAALRHKEQTGHGQHIDISLFDSGLASMLNPASAWFNGKVEIGLTSNDHPSAAPYGVFEVDDGYVIIATFSDRDFERLANTLGHPDWLIDSRFATNGGRVTHRDELKAKISASLVGYSKLEIVRVLNGSNVSCGPINTMADIESDPHAIDRESVISINHPVNGPVRSVSSPIRLSETPASYRLAPPQHGEHTATVLKSMLQLSDSEISELKLNGSIGGVRSE